MIMVSLVKKCNVKTTNIDCHKLQLQKTSQDHPVQVSEIELPRSVVLASLQKQTALMPLVVASSPLQHSMPCHCNSGNESKASTCCTKDSLLPPLQHDFWKRLCNASLSLMPPAALQLQDDITAAPAKDKCHCSQFLIYVLTALTSPCIACRVWCWYYCNWQCSKVQ